MLSLFIPLIECSSPCGIFSDEEGRRIDEEVSALRSDGATKLSAACSGEPKVKPPTELDKAIKNSYTGLFIKDVNELKIVKTAQEGAVVRKNNTSLHNTLNEHRAQLAKFIAGIKKKFLTHPPGSSHTEITDITSEQVEYYKSASKTNKKCFSHFIKKLPKEQPHRGAVKCRRRLFDPSGESYSSGSRPPKQARTDDTVNPEEEEETITTENPPIKA